MSAPHVEVVDCTMAVTWPPPAPSRPIPFGGTGPDPAMLHPTTPRRAAPPRWDVLRNGRLVGCTGDPAVAEQFREAGYRVKGTRWPT